MKTIDKKPSTRPTRRTLSPTWKKAAGMLRHRKTELERHIKRVRAEWRGR